MKWGSQVFPRSPNSYSGGLLVTCSCIFHSSWCGFLLYNWCVHTGVALSMCITPAKFDWYVVIAKRLSFLSVCLSRLLVFPQMIKLSG